MMKVRTVRFLLLATLFIIVVMAIYYAFTPRSFFQHHMRQEHRNITSSLLHKVSSRLSLSKTAVAIRPSKESVKTTVAIRPSKESVKTTVAIRPSKESVKTTVAIRPSKESGGGLVIMANTSASLEMVREMHRRNGVVLFTMINDAFLDFAASWCCNTATFNNLHQRTLFLTTDVQTGEELRSLFPSVSTVAMSSPQFRGSQEYSRAGYVRMMTERTRFILRLLEAGVPLLLFEVDCVWLADPLPLLLPRQSKADILATRVTGSDVTAGGFLLLTPTKATVKFWHQLTRKMDELFSAIMSREKSAYISEALNDQEFFTHLARMKYAGIKIEYLPSNTFPDGKWYSLPEKQRRKSQPVIINNNWVLGIDAKRQRAKAFGHWFWDESKRKCDTSAVDHLFH